MATGKIKFFNEEKGYGFIAPDDGSSDLFVHHSDTDGYALNDGDGVDYEVGEGKKGPCAKEVKLIR